MKGLVAIWRKLSFILVVWVTGSFALSQGVSWEIFKPIGKGGEAIVCLWGIIVATALLIASLLLAASYARSGAARPRLARVPPVTDDLDAGAGAAAFAAIQGVVLLLTVLWPLYCVGHFALKIADVPLYPCTRPASEGCAPDLRDAAKVGQWHLELPLRIYRFGADSQSQGVDFLPFVEPLLLHLLELCALAFAAFFGARLLRRPVEPDQDW